MKRFLILSLILTVLLSGLYSCKPYSRLQLEQVTIVSRHGVRVPLLKYMNDLDSIKSTDYSWPVWPVEGGHLSVRGSMLEYLSGEFFQGYLESAGLNLSASKSFFCASPKQRTVETARAFAAGMFPHQTIDVFYRGPRQFEPKYLDPQFLPLFNDWDYSGEFDQEAFQKEARREMIEIARKAEEEAVGNLEFLSSTIGFAKSKYAECTKKTVLKWDIEDNICLDFYKENGTGEMENQEPSFKKDSDFIRANRASDALILQYYEQDDKVLKDTSTLNMTSNLEDDDWLRLASIKDVYGDVLFTAPIVAVNVSHSMLGMIRSMMNDPAHSLNYVCTHDSSMAALMAALQIEDYVLKETIERRTPIGFKLLFEKWSSCRESYVRVIMAYYSTNQIRTSNPADVQGAPIFVELGFNGIKRASNGLYRYDDFMRHIDKTLEAYDLTAQGKNPFEN